MLVGDAAHTAHFSIGSGTKLALEDAIELAAALGAPRRVAAALVEYELRAHGRWWSASRGGAPERRVLRGGPAPLGLPPLQFAFNLLTRSGRIGHANLFVRDPRLVRRVDSFVGGGKSGPAPAVRAAGAQAGSGCANRAVGQVLDAASARACTCPRPSPSRPKGGSPPMTRSTPPRGAPTSRPSTRRAVPRCSRSTTPAGAARAGPARRASTSRCARRLAARLGVAGRLWPPQRTPDELDETRHGADPRRVRQAAQRGAEAGFDAVELNLGEGYLLGSFLTSRANRRTDAYGEDRLRFPATVVEAVRAAFNGPLAVRLSEGEHAAALREAGADLVHVATGQATEAAAAEYRRGHLTAFSDRIRSEAHVATMVGGYLDTLDAANTIVGAGRADLCVLEPAAFA